MPNTIEILANPRRGEVAFFSENKLIGIFQKFSDQYFFDELRDGEWGNEEKMLAKITESKEANAALKRGEYDKWQASRMKKPT